MYVGEIKTEIIKYANREGDEQFEAMLKWAIVFTCKTIENGLGQIFPELEGQTAIPPYLIFNHHFKEDATPTDYTIPSSGLIVLRPSGGETKKLTKILSFFVSQATPDKYYPLKQMSYERIMEKYGVPAYQNVAPSSYALTGKPEAYHVFFGNNESNDYVTDDVGATYAMIRPIPPSSDTYYYTFSYVRDPYVTSYSETTSVDLGNPWLLHKFPYLVIYGSLYFLAQVYTDMDTQKYRQLFLMSAKQYKIFSAEFSNDELPKHIEVAGGLNVI